MKQHQFNTHPRPVMPYIVWILKQPEKTAMKIKFASLCKLIVPNIEKLLPILFPGILCFCTVYFFLYQLAYHGW